MARTPAASPESALYFIYSSPTLKEFHTFEDAEKVVEKAAFDNPGRKFYVARCAGTVQTETTIKKERFNG